MGLVVLAGVLWGMLRFRQFHERVTLWKQSLLFLQKWETVLRYQAIPLCEMGQVFPEADRNPVYLNVCIAEMKKGMAFPEAWKIGVSALGGREKEERLLLEFGAELGKSDVEGQMAHCRMHEVLWKEEYALAKEELAKKGKLFLLLGISGGIGVVLFLV